MAKKKVITIAVAGAALVIGSVALLSKKAQAVPPPTEERLPIEIIWS